MSDWTHEEAAVMPAPVKREAHAAQVLLEHLAEGWKESSADVARDLINRLRAAFDASIDLRDAGDNYIRFRMEMAGIRLAGMHQVQCLLLSGQAVAAHDILSAFLIRHTSTSQCRFVFAVSEGARAATAAETLAGIILILTPSEIAGILEASSPSRQLKGLLLARVPRRSLIPFNTKDWAEDNMYFGRGSPLSRLSEEPNVSFAVAGPSRIGKTSLLQRYRRQLVRERDSRMHSTFYIDLYSCGNYDPDRIAPVYRVENRQ